MENLEGFIVLVDISGYTKFVRSHNMKKIPFLGKQVEKKTEAHAEHIISDLLECVIEELEGTLTVNKIEGDAVLFYSTPANLNEYPKFLIDKIRSSFEIFAKRLREIAFCDSCPCDACHQMGNLKLKSFIHFGDFMVKRVSRFEELAGENVILAHRLMKNSIKSSEYILLTENANKICGSAYLPAVESRTESYEDLGEVSVSVFYPDRETHEPSATDGMSFIKKARQMQQYFKNTYRREQLSEKYTPST
tara:strand:+ start:1368 stop:2114 length:747 start_codon:yes stop_codon:yes gene_type:complete